MSLAITAQVTDTTVLNARKLVEEKMEVDTSGVALIMVTDVKLEGVKAFWKVNGEEIIITYAEGETGVGSISFEAVLV